MLSADVAHTIICENAAKFYGACFSQSAGSDAAAYSASESGVGTERFWASETMRPAKPA